jgi:26S proteasome regulatory subunit N8
MFIPTSVTVHPLVLLSVTDHYYRVAKDTRRRVVGVLLGETTKDGHVECSNAYAVPFEEDERDSSVWFLDHNYHENMFSMFRKVSAKEKVVGWYSTGPKIRANDLAIHEVFRAYTSNPVYVIVDVKPQQHKIPTEAYYSKEEIADESSEPKMAFQHLPSEIGAVEAEEIGVEHLLRDIKDTTVSSLSTQITEKIASLAQLEQRLAEIRTYCDNVLSGKLPINHAIMYLLQDVLNLLPNLSIREMATALTTRTNDRMAVIYVSSLIRSVIALHDLINNKVALKERESKAMGGADNVKKEGVGPGVIDQDTSTGGKEGVEKAGWGGRS